MDPVARADPQQLAAQVLAGDRGALARLITLCESARPDDRGDALAALTVVAPHAADPHRVGITGAAGAGKSTLVEALGLHLLAAGHRVAVLAVDPSSTHSGGALLGDKTRMRRLAAARAAFVRPSPAGPGGDGVGRRTGEAVLACAAAGYDPVIVETVGAGQSQRAVADLVDTLVLVVAPGGGDELQGLKRGVIEDADLVVVTKADGAGADAAAAAGTHHRAGLGAARPRAAGWRPRVLVTSAHTGAGVQELAAQLRAHRAQLRDSGALGTRRAAGARAVFWSELVAQLLDDVRGDPGIRSSLQQLQARVGAGELLPAPAARAVLELYRGKSDRGKS